MHLAILAYLVILVDLVTAIQYVMKYPTFLRHHVITDAKQKPAMVEERRKLKIALAKVEREEKINEKIQNLRRLNENLDRKIQKICKEQDIQEKTIEKEEGKLRVLRNDPGYKSRAEIKRLSDEINQLESGEEQQQGAAWDKFACPICFEDAPGKKIFSCQECENWVCGDCKSALNNCPHCRVSLSFKPLKRNKTAERLML